MWEYTFPDDDAAYDFCMETLLWLGCPRVRDGHVVLTLCPPERADEAVRLCPLWPGPPATRRFIRPSRTQTLEALCDLMDHTGVEDRHVLADMWLLAYINDPSITASFESINKFYS